MTGESLTTARFGPLRLAASRGVGTVTIDHPPTNLVDGAFVGGLIALLDAVSVDATIRALVFVSADPDFFLMHGDVEAILALPAGAPPSGAERRPNLAAAAFERLRTSPFVSIAALDGAARGGGAEFCLACDLRCGTPRTVVGQPEVPMGILPGAGGTARLARLVGRGRALELIVTARDVGADEALAIGWLDAVVPAASLLEHCDGLARRIAAMPAASVAAVKGVVDVSLGSIEPALVAESAALSELLATGAHHGPMRRFLAEGGQTREGETSRMAAIIDSMLAG